MSQLILCRVCLAGNVKIHWIRGTPLQVLYEKLTSYKLSTKDERPETICYNCLAQLQRYHRFHNKLQKSQEIMTQLSENGIEIFKDTVDILNRGIQHDYSATDLEVYSCPKYEQVIVKQENVSVKVENITSNLNVENGENFSGFIAESDAVICVVCLVGDVKTCSIRNTPLEVVFQKLLNSKSSTTRDEMVCYMCHWQLIKCRRFINKSKKSESILTELLRNGIQLSQATVTLLNRGIKPNLETASVETTSYYSPDNEPCENSPKKQMNTKNGNSTDLIKCGKCDFKTTSIRKYNEHLERHSKKCRFPCNICGYRYSSVGRLSSHKRTVHRNNYKCKKCNSQFAKKRQFNMHLLTHTANAVTCQQCNIILKNRCMLREHNKKVHRQDKYPCIKCNGSFTTERCLCDHIMKMHTIHFPFYTCDLCDKSYATKHVLQKHMKFVHMNIRKFKCDICGKLWPSKLVLSQHLLFHAKTKTYKCTQCRKAYRYRTGLHMHMKSHNELKPYACTFCNKSFSYKTALQMHNVSHNKFVCDICSKEFSRKYFLREHIVNHMTGLNKSYDCVECGKSFLLNGELKIHMYKHMNRPKKVIPFETCQICYKQTKTLRVHMRLHTGEKPFSCKCGKSYTSAASLRTHQKKVTNDKPYECTTCGKCFKKKYYLKVHESQHSEIKPYTCIQCGKSYPHRDKLYVHMRSHQHTKFTCEECGNIFTEKRSLEHHIINFHKDEKEPIYACDICFKVYLNKNELISHLKTHRKPKSFTCNAYNCTKSFSKLCRFAGHMLKHSTDKKSQCRFCNVVCNRGILLRHYLSKHGGLRPFACNSCDESFVQFKLVYYHYIRLHKSKDHDREKPYLCEYCESYHTRSGSLKRHVIKYHTK